MYKQLIQLFIMYLLSFLGATMFYFAHIPLPWILGPLLATFIYNTYTTTTLSQNKFILNISFLFTGCQIGATFTTTTLEKVIPYFVPFFIITVLLIYACMKSGELLAKYASIGKTTGVLGSIPGGLSVMVEMSDSLKANTGLVAIFHTIRLMAVLMIVPLLASFMFTQTDTATMVSDRISFNVWTAILYGLLFILAYLLRRKIPAPFVLIPMIIIACFKISGIEVGNVPVSLYHFAQVSIGIHLGLSITMSDIKKAGNFSWVFFLFTCVIIMLSVGLGYIFASMSNLSFATAMLSLAPGGLVEMAITAGEVNADPAIVGSLQLVRLLFIILILPFALKKWTKFDS
ncbi:AbrB family transcriptional regulator [Gracilibacillus caseinilyticus]|uniref:AbrB family transcriptional regulator n=1 Tax=Gracilibacillus caseinilyticus TaxID=2932256 RepID=A0ABY4ET85_9BACI|nr:AbrB family transcriptional regulator [Gracilibacillus caseinilyticus]UOQ47633.1 AbrB family transcriptional regulator [Gracilibacillus caseinilyticus]